MHVLLDDDDRASLLGYLAADADDILDNQRRQPLEWLVQKNEPRLAHERTRNRQHLLLPAGKIAPAVIAPFGQARKHLVSARVAPSVGRRQPGERKILVDSEAADDTPIFRYKLNYKRRDLVGRQSLHALPVEMDGPVPRG